MRRSLRNRIETAEELAAAEVKKRDERQKQWVEAKRVQARRHATSVGAIVLAGQPRIDEPLKETWTRTLRHYRISEEISGTKLLANLRSLLFRDIEGDEEEEA